MRTLADWATPRFVRICCPICKKEIENAPDDFGPRPFCSFRCKQVDLGNWLSDQYVISEPLPDLEVEDEKSRLN